VELGIVDIGMPAGPVLMCCLRMADGLNTITRRGEIGTSVPVLGLRPIRCPFLRTTKVPNDESFTISPRSRQAVSSLSTVSARAADSIRDRAAFFINGLGEIGARDSPLGHRRLKSISYL
jgi:hypothetical protein